MCRFNLQATDKQGVGLVRKSISLLTNSTVIADYLGRKCLGGHRHVQLFGGDKCARAAIYTPEFSRAIVEAYRLHKAHIGSRSSSSKQKKSLIGSLEARDNHYSPTTTPTLADDDVEDLPSISDLMEIYEGHDVWPVRLSQSDGAVHR